MNSLLILLYVVVWRVYTILRVIAPESAARAWCEYHLEGMSILRYTYRTLAKAAEMREGEAPLPPEGCPVILKASHIIWVTKAAMKSWNQDFSGCFCGIYVRKAMRWVLL